MLLTMESKTASGSICRIGAETFAWGRIQLHWEGVSHVQSYKRIAQRHGIKVRSVERIWRERLTLNSAAPRTISDFMSALSKVGVTLTALPDEY